MYQFDIQSSSSCSKFINFTSPSSPTPYDVPPSLLISFPKPFFEFFKNYPIYTSPFSYQYIPTPSIFPLFQSPSYDQFITLTFAGVIMSENVGCQQKYLDWGSGQGWLEVLENVSPRWDWWSVEWLAGARGGLGRLGGRLAAQPIFDGMLLVMFGVYSSIRIF